MILNGFFLGEFKSRCHATARKVKDDAQQVLDFKCLTPHCRLGSHGFGTSHFAGFAQSCGQIATASSLFAVSQNRNSEEKQNDFPGAAAGTNGAQIIPNG
jgi:hypothetical protein